MPASLPDPIVIVDGARTPMGGFQGELSAVSAPQLGAASIIGALSRSAVPADAVDEVIMGCVLPAGLGQAPARQASLGAGISDAVACTTVNKMCGSGMKAVMLCHDALIAGSSKVMIAGGMESMSNAPYLLPNVRGGMRMGHGDVKDHMFLDGLEDAYEPGKLMGHFADNTATHYQFTREAQDDFAISSLERAQAAMHDGSFLSEIEPVVVNSKRASATITADEQPPKANVERIRTLRPAFNANGTVTAANASSISDGAAALIMMRESEAKKHQLKPRFRLLAHATHAQEPKWFTTAPVFAIEKLLAGLSMNVADIDLFEINEAFAVVTLAAMQQLALPHEKVNVYGGACALGHPIGASGARIVVTLMNALERKNKHTGVASLCIGGGEATAIVIERMA